MISLSVDAGDGETQYLGKSANELQSGIVISGDSISGTLNYIDNYTKFSSKASERKGNYLVLKLSSENGTVITKITGNGASGKDVTVNDGFCVYRVTSTEQKIEVKATKDDKVVSKTYSLNGLDLRPSEAV